MKTFLLPCVESMLAGGLAGQLSREALKPFGQGAARRVKLCFANI